ncbi:MAG: patatin-like phospholipase family protein [Bacteroidales bacterium]|nr:patatin-like phospholipase family protein [Bacteroidales bacterium]
MIDFFKKKYLSILLLAFWPITMFFYLRKMHWQDLFEIIRSIRFVLLLMSLGLLAFTLIPQGQHMLMSLGQPKGQVWQNIFILIALVYWSYQVYYGSRILLKLSNLRYDDEGILRLYNYKMKTPIILGVTPFWIIITAYLMANGMKGGWDLTVIILLIVIMLLINWYYYYRSCLTNACEANPEKTYFELKDELIGELHPIAFTYFLRFNFILLICVFTILVTGFTFLSIWGISVLQFIGPTAIVITALASWISMTNTIAIINTKYFKYFSSILVVLFLVSSHFNNNNRVYLLEDAPQNRVSVSAHFNHWADIRTKNSDSEEYPVFVVAVEGGGSRSAYWAGSVLAALSDEIPEFSSHIFGISTVSGGSLGTVVYQMLLNQNHGTSVKRTMLQQAQSILKQDFLSPLSASFGYPDMIQQFIPFEISMFDRSKALERSWEKACDDVMNSGDKSSPLKQSFHDIWADDEDYQLPAIFINATWVETGKRVIFSNLQTDDSEFYNAIDFFETIGKDIKLSTAVSLSSRFPFITPAGGIKKDGDKLWGHIADGGYFDNSGVTTAGEMISIINKENSKRDSGPNFIPYLIIISSRSNYQTKAGSFYELTEPIVTIVNQTLDGTVSYARKQVIANRKLGGVIDVKLQLPLNDVPLGWYLSDYSVIALNQRVSEVVGFHDRRIQNIINNPDQSIH